MINYINSITILRSQIIAEPSITGPIYPGANHLNFII
jgi:hypothetical protein